MPQSVNAMCERGGNLVCRVERYREHEDATGVGGQHRVRGWLAIKQAQHFLLHHCLGVELKYLVPVVGIENLDWMLSQVPRKINRRPSGFGRTFV